MIPELFSVFMSFEDSQITATSTRSSFGVKLRIQHSIDVLKVPCQAQLRTDMRISFSLNPRSPVQYPSRETSAASQLQTTKTPMARTVMTSWDTSDLSIMKPLLPCPGLWEN
ncbi:hypothetical protein RRG08_051888 [Elysia crispata]|uniref:Uncharacterized protein n=1 Tax=Elysia crispata TaxID=231223 RepID=A0AAE0ZB89_9GAST|nr:hypothetical protein RRG08_051888 [Elysia crispata]